MIAGSIEQDIPVHELLHLAALGESDLEIIEARLEPGSPAVGRASRDLEMPPECSLFAVVRDGHATPLRPDTVLREGDKVIAIGKSECEAMLREQLIGRPAAANGLIGTANGGSTTAGSNGGEPVGTVTPVGGDGRPAGG
jgi:Trk K+ transport system NAD-binding subunit